MFPHIAEKKLDNGLKVICAAKKSAPIVSVQVWYKSGSANEHDGIRGISHFFEHMMFRGSERFGPEEHARRINEIGGHCNAFTAEDITAYVNSVPRDYLEMVLELEADRMKNLRITKETLETERMVIIEEYHTYMNNPVAKSFLEFRKAFFGKHPYAISPLGILDDIKTISLDDCVEYYRAWYSPSNAVITVVGDIDTHEKVLAAAEKHFGAIAASSPGVPCRELPAPRPETGGFRFMKRRVEFDVPIVLLGYAAPPSSHVDTISLDILQQIISHGETGRLHRELVRKQSIAVMAGGMNHQLKHAGMSLFFAAFTPDISARRIESSLKEQMARICAHGITRQEMEKVKNATLSGRIFDLYSGEHICQRLGFCETVEGDFRAWMKRLEMLEKVDIDMLTAVARKYWGGDQGYTLYLKPRKVRPLLMAAGLARRVFARKHKDDGQDG